MENPSISSLQWKCISTEDESGSEKERKSFGIFHRYQIPISYQWPLSISDEIEIQFSALNSWPVHFGSNWKLSRIGERLWNELCADIN